MLFPLVGVPNWLAAILPLFFSPEQHQNAVIASAVAFINAFALIFVPMVDGRRNDVNHSFMVAGLLIGVSGLMLLLFGGYAMLSLLVIFGLFLLGWIINRALRIMGWVQ